MIRFVELDHCPISFRAAGDCISAEFARCLARVVHFTVRNDRDCQVVFLGLSYTKPIQDNHKCTTKSFGH